MLEDIDFTTFDPENRSGDSNGISFMRFESGKTYRVRPIGNCVGYYKFFIAKGKPSLVFGPKEKDAAAKLLSEHSGQEMRPTHRYAMFVIDREDGRIKILEGGPQIYDAFGSWTKGSGLKPGSLKAGDWQIVVTGEGAGGSNPRRYSSVYLSPTVFSNDERKMIEDLRSDDKLKLSNFLIETPLDQVLEKAYGVKGEPVAVGASDKSSQDDELDW